MAGINKVILIGNLGKDPDVYNFENGAKKVTFSMATTETYKDQNGGKVETTEWHNIVMWGPLAEIAEKYLKKGQLVYIEGSIKRRSWEDENHNKHYSFDIVADKMKMLGGKKTSISSEDVSTTDEIPENQNFTDDNLTDDLPF